MVITGNRKHPVDRVKAESNAAICERANQVKGNVAMNSRRVRNSRTVLVSAAIAHLLAWAAFLWIALYPHAYQGVSATPLNVSGAGATDTEREREVERYSASYAEINGYGALIPLFVPVLATAVALFSLVAWKERRAANTWVLWISAIILLLFCGLGYLSFGVLYLPAAVALILAAAVFSLSPRRPDSSSA